MTYAEELRQKYQKQNKMRSKVQRAKEAIIDACETALKHKQKVAYVKGMLYAQEALRELGFPDTSYTQEGDTFDPVEERVVAIYLTNV